MVTAVVSWYYWIMAAKKRAPGSRTKKVEVPLTPQEYENARNYSREHGFGLAAILRAIMRIWFDPQDPRPLPPNIERENKRPPRK